MAVVAGTKVGSLYSRALPAFQRPIEFGVNVPYDDYRFLRAYETHNFITGQSGDITVINTVADMGDRVPEIAINDFDGNSIKNTLIGPSSNSTNSSKGIIAFEQGRKTASKQITLSSAVSASFSQRDNILIARSPLFLEAGEETVDTTMRGTVRSPKMAGITGHTNSFVCYGSTGTLQIRFDMTNKASIDPDMVYRFSFYYRTKCDNAPEITLNLSFYTNEGSLIGIDTYPDISLDRITSEDGDFSYFSIAIPYISGGYSIPTNTKRIELTFDIVASGGDPITFEMIYPVLEHTFKLSKTSGYVFIPYSPSSIIPKEDKSGTLDISVFGSVTPFDTTRLFMGHPGRDFFNVSISWSLIDSAYVNQMRLLEQMNSMGYSIVFRSKHPDLPPVMIGDIKVSTSNPNYDYNDNDMTIEFKETV